LTKTNARMLCEGNYYTNRKAETELGFRQTNIREPIENALDWFKTNHYFNL